MKAERPDRNPVKASFWQFDPEREDPDVEAMDAAISFVRSEEGLVLLAVRGKPGRNYEKKDSVWLELTDAETLRLIERLAATLTQEMTI